jgi:hypothetical protein
MACAIADAQAALFAGRHADLEMCVARMKSLCASLKAVEDRLRGEPPSATPALVLAVRNAHMKNRIFAAALGRMRRHLDTVRAVMNGRSLGYEPKVITLPERHR